MSGNMCCHSLCWNLTQARPLGLNANETYRKEASYTEPMGSRTGTAKFDHKTTNFRRAKELSLNENSGLI